MAPPKTAPAQLATSVKNPAFSRTLLAFTRYYDRPYVPPAPAKKLATNNFPKWVPEPKKDLHIPTPGADRLAAKMATRIPGDYVERRVERTGTVAAKTGGNAPKK